MAIMPQMSTRPSTLRDRIPNTIARQSSLNSPGTLRYSPGVYGLDMSIQVLDSRRSRSRGGSINSNLNYQTFQKNCLGFIYP